MTVEEDNLTNVEFAIKIENEQCLNKVKSSLLANGVDQIHSVLDEGEARIVISTSKPWIELHEVIEKAGFQSALVGFSEQSAVSILDKGNLTNIKGVVRFCENKKSETLVIDGVIDGLEKATDHVLMITEYGDVSDGCNNLGDTYKNSSFSTVSNDVGRVVLRTVTKSKLTIPEIIGRGVCITDSVSGDKLACGVISRSAGIFQNFKRICVCSGKVLWDERDLQNIVKK